MIAAAATIWVVFVSANQFVKSSGFLSEEKVKVLLSEKNLYDRRLNANAAGTDHQYELQEINGDSVVIDHATNLTWQRSGSGYYMNYESAQVYIDSLNSAGFASSNDWRLPTLEEGMSLMEPQRQNGDLYIDTRFDKYQRWIWTADKSSASIAWVVYFNLGFCVNNHVDINFFVRAVR